MSHYELDTSAVLTILTARILLHSVFSEPMICLSIKREVKSVIVTLASNLSSIVLHSPRNKFEYRTKFDKITALHAHTKSIFCCYA